MDHHEMVLATSNARTVARYLTAGHRVLSTCYMGLNRSSLVAGLAMRQAFDMSADDVIEQIREQRGPLALSNRNFRRLIHRFE